MSDHDDFKKNLLDASWRRYKTVTVEGARGQVELDIRMPPPSVLAELMAKGKALKDSSTASEMEAQSFAMEVIAATVWRPGALRQLFTPDEVKMWPHASLVQADCLAALSAATGMETAKGNLGATPASASR